jgi:hypothetical protein
MLALSQSMKTLPGLNNGSNGVESFIARKGTWEEFVYARKHRKGQRKINKALRRTIRQIRKRQHCNEMQRNM